MKKKLLFAAIGAALLLTMTACGTGAADTAPESEIIADSERDALYAVLDNLNQGQKTGVKDEDVPEPPAAEDWLPELWSRYECRQRGVDVDGNRATYLIYVEKDGTLYSSLEQHFLILEYDRDEGAWSEVKSGSYTVQFTVHEAEFIENDWLIQPTPESEGIVIAFNSVTSNSCVINWESPDPNVTLNGTASGSGQFTYQTGVIDDAVCWVLDGAEIVYNDDGEEHTYCIRIEPDVISALMGDPFSPETEHGVVMQRQKESS